MLNVRTVSQAKAYPRYHGCFVNFCVPIFLWIYVYFKRTTFDIRNAQILTFQFASHAVNMRGHHGFNTPFFYKHQENSAEAQICLIILADFSKQAWPPPLKHFLCNALSFYKLVFTETPLLSEIVKFLNSNLSLSMLMSVMPIKKGVLKSVCSNLLFKME